MHKKTSIYCKNLEVNSKLHYFIIVSKNYASTMQLIVDIRKKQITIVLVLMHDKENYQDSVRSFLLTLR